MRLRMILGNASLAGGLIAVLALRGGATAQQLGELRQREAEPGCRVVCHGQTVELHSPFFVCHLSIKDGLRAECWENRVTGTRLALGGGLELEVDVGLPAGQITTARWSATRIKSDAPSEVIFELVAEEARLTATVRYTWDAKQPVLRKFAEIRNDGNQAINRLLNLRLGDYAPPRGTEILAASGRGFPAYVAGEYFLSLAHPAGCVDVENGRLTLRQYPGTTLGPGETFRCMEAVWGVAASGNARNSFVRYVRRRMRRVLRGHDRPYATLESFGGQPNGDFRTTEPYLLNHLIQVGQSLREGGPKFDFYSIEFWHDSTGDLTRFHPDNFPQGFTRVRDEILRLGMQPGLWIDSGGLPEWTIRDNPDVRGCFTQGDGKGEICRATEPINSLYKKAFIHHVRENKVGLLKFDNLGPGGQFPCCNNPSHSHLPGPLYSVEAIHNAVIDFLRELDAACPDVFIMLYWGYRSPWWLQYGDTYFECGQHIEAASPTDFPAAYGRDSVTQRLDQAQSLILDTPWLGKDSLGIWLSDWPWNSCIGKARWQEGLIMDLCRGSLLAQIWTDTNYLATAERQQLADFIALLKSNPDCFDNPQPILGSPSKPETCGYACSNGQRAFLAIHNASLKDSLSTIPLGHECGLADKTGWDVYRWYPQPAKLKDRTDNFGRRMQIALRPHQVVLLEVVPSGLLPSLGRKFQQMPIPIAFSEPTRALELTTKWVSSRTNVAMQWHVLTPNSASADGATLVIHADGSILASGENVEGDVYSIAAQSDAPHIAAVMIETLTDDSFISRGPGRAENGNFALTDFRLLAAPSNRPDRAAEIKLRTARADFSQTSYGGWPVTAAIDADPASGWSIHPKVGMAHAAVFDLETPINSSAGATLTFKLTQGQNRHGIGRLRISVSSTESPSLPAEYLPGRLEIRMELPPSRAGGVVLLTGPKGMSTPAATLAGRDLQLTPVWSDKAWYACPWQAWRAGIGTSSSERPLLVMLESERSSALPQLAAHFLHK